MRIHKKGRHCGRLGRSGCCEALSQHAPECDSGNGLGLRSVFLPTQDQCFDIQVSVRLRVKAHPGIRCRSPFPVSTMAEQMAF